MKATGITKVMDDLGRIQINKEIRKLMHLEPGDKVEFYLQKDYEEDVPELVVRKYDDSVKKSEILDVKTRLLDIVENAEDCKKIDELFDSIINIYIRNKNY